MAFGVEPMAPHHPAQNVDNNRARGYGDSKMKSKVTARGRRGMRWENYERDMETCGTCPELETCPTAGAIVMNNPSAMDNLKAQDE